MRLSAWSTCLLPVKVNKHLTGLQDVSVINCVNQINSLPQQAPTLSNLDVIQRRRQTSGAQTLIHNEENTFLVDHHARTTIERPKILTLAVRRTPHQSLQTRIADVNCVVWADSNRTATIITPTPAKI